MEKINSAQVNRAQFNKSRLILKQFEEEFKNTPLNLYINATKYPEQNVIAEPTLKPQSQYKSEISANRTTGDKTFNSVILAKSQILIEAEKMQAKGKEISAKKRHLSFIEGQTSKNIAKGFFNIVTLAIPYVFLLLYSYLWGDKVVENNEAKAMAYYSATEERCKNFCHDLAKIDKHLSAQAPSISALENYFLNHDPELIENKIPGIQDSHKILLPEHLYEDLYDTLVQICKKHHKHPETMECDHFYTIKDGDSEFCIKFIKDGEGYDYLIYVDNYFSHNTPEDIKARCAYVETQRNILSKDDYSSTLMQALMEFNRELSTNPRRIKLDHLYTIMNDGTSEVCIKIKENGNNYDFSIYATDRNGQLVEIKKYYAMNLLLAEFAGIKPLDKLTSFKVSLNREVLVKTVLSELLSAGKLKAADKLLSEVLGQNYKSSITEEHEAILKTQEDIKENIETLTKSINHHTLSFLSTAIGLGQNEVPKGFNLEDYKNQFLLKPLDDFITEKLAEGKIVDDKIVGIDVNDIAIAITKFLERSLTASFKISEGNLNAFKEKFDTQIAIIANTYQQVLWLKLISSQESTENIMKAEKKKLAEAAKVSLTQPKYSVPLVLIAREYLFAVIKDNSPKLLGYMIEYLKNLSDNAKLGVMLSPLKKTAALKILSFIGEYYNYKDLSGNPLFPRKNFIEEREDRMVEDPELPIAKPKGPALMKIEDQDLDKIFSSLRPEDLNALETLNFKRKEHISADDNLRLLPLLLSGVIPIIDPDSGKENTMLKEYFQLSSFLTREEIKDTSSALTVAERITDFGYFISILEELISTAENITYSIR